MSIRQKPAHESGIEWCGTIAGREYGASGSFGPTLGHLSLHGQGTDGSSSLLGTVTWNGEATERMCQVSAVLAMVASELKETLEREQSRG
jgi:hypothetical protein